ncbi:MAG: hypothetical protein KDK54_05225 [Leptospiraceae bacterium]|nr:hypothetical protein [Leptospiraceae bacterium]
MNSKTAKIINKYAELKGLNPKHIKREWNSLNESEKDLKRQEYLEALPKK